MTRISGIQVLLLTPVLLVVTACGEGDRFEKAKQQNTVAAYDAYLADRPKRRQPPSAEPRTSGRPYPWTNASTGVAPA